MKLDFKPLDLTDIDIAVKFRADSFYASFGHDRDFWGEDGEGDKRYVDWLKKKLSLSRPMAFHVWKEDEIIGQIEFGFYKGDRNTGYVNLYYLIPEARGRGFSSYLDEFTTNYFKSLNLKKMLLSVSPANMRAISYYKKNGWEDLGPRFSEAELREGNFPQIHLMQKFI